MSKLTDTPKVGDGVTLYGWTDAYAYTVIEVVNAKRVKIQRDIANRTNREDDTFSPGGFLGHTESPNGQQWSYEPDPDGRIVTITRRKDGLWRESYTGGYVAAVGEGRREHRDYNF